MARQRMQYTEEVPNFLKGLMVARRPPRGSDEEDDEEEDEHGNPVSARVAAAAKFAQEEALRADRPDRDDETPQVVQLRDGDLSRVQADALLKTGQDPGAVLVGLVAGEGWVLVGLVAGEGWVRVGRMGRWLRGCGGVWGVGGCVGGGGVGALQRPPWRTLMSSPVTPCTVALAP